VLRNLCQYRSSQQEAENLELVDHVTRATNAGSCIESGIVASQRALILQLHFQWVMCSHFTELPDTLWEWIQTMYKKNA